MNADKLVNFFHQTSSFSRTQIAELLMVASKDEIHKVLVDDRTYSINLDNFLDFLPAYKELKIENGCYVIGKDKLCTIEENVNIGKKYIAMLNDVAMKMDNNSLGEKGFENYDITDQTFALQGLDENDPSVSDVNKLAEELDTIKINRAYFPVEKAKSFFPKLEGKMIKECPYTIESVDNSVEINNYYYAPTTQIQAVMKMIKSKNAVQIVKAFKAFHKKSEIEVAINARGRISLLRKGQVNQPNKIAVNLVKYEKSDKEKEFLKLIDEDKKDDAAIAFGQFCSQENIQGFDYDFDSIMKIYQEWVSTKTVVPYSTSSPNLNVNNVFNTNPFNNVVQNISTSHINLNLGSTVDQIPQGDLDTRVKTLQHFKDFVQVDETKYFIKVSGKSVTVPTQNNQMDGFINYVGNSCSNYIAKLLLDDLDLKVEIQMKLYPQDKFGLFKSKLEKNFQYLQYRMNNGKIGTSKIPAFVIFYEVFQFILMSMEFCNEDAIPDKLKQYKIDILIFYWVSQIFKDTGNFTRGDTGANWFFKCYSVTNKNQSLPVEYMQGVKKNINSNNTTTNYSDGGGTGGFF